MVQRMKVSQVLTQRLGFVQKVIWVAMSVIQLEIQGPPSKGLQVPGGLVGKDGGVAGSGDGVGDAAGGTPGGLAGGWGDGDDAWAWHCEAAGSASAGQCMQGCGVVEG
jgi:hypothetical protein